MLTPKVTEQKRGSAHGGTTSGKAAKAPKAERKDNSGPGTAEDDGDD